MAAVTLIISIILFVGLLVTQMIRIHKKNPMIRRVYYIVDFILIILFVAAAANPFLLGIGMLISCVGLVVMMTVAMFLP